MDGKIGIYLCKIAQFSQCGEWPYSFVTFVANKKILLDIAVIDVQEQNFGQPSVIKLSHTSTNNAPSKVQLGLLESGSAKQKLSTHKHIFNRCRMENFSLPGGKT
jgi:hypothetical protein